jgi:alkylation response protein AidB-like acyl-CoA dehydrogenase
MNVRDTPGEAAFRKDLRAWLDDNAPHGLASDDPLQVPPDLVEPLKTWQRSLASAGWAGINWPRDYGGRGATLIEQAIYYQEMARCGAPEPFNKIGLATAGPTIVVHGTDEQRRRYLPRILSADDIWAQGFSEPAAGSDLASVKTKGVLDGDAFVINGQKTWMSMAQYADLCLLLVRTNPDVPRHKGLTYLILDMHAPGVEVRPLRDMTDHTPFNEVFLTDVTVPLRNVLGGIDRGWEVAMTTLGEERSTFGALSIESQARLGQLIELAKRRQLRGRPAIEDPLIRARLAAVKIQFDGVWYTHLKSLSATMKSGVPGNEGSLLKLVWALSSQKMCEIALEILGGNSVYEDADEETSLWQQRHLQSRASTIAGGTTDIVRNVVAERMLGLPRLR